VLDNRKQPIHGLRRRKGNCVVPLTVEDNRRFAVTCAVNHPPVTKVGLPLALAAGRSCSGYPIFAITLGIKADFHGVFPAIVKEF
jgi:hypothetical protein